MIAEGEVRNAEGCVTMVRVPLLWQGRGKGIVQSVKSALPPPPLRERMATTAHQQSV